MSTRFDHKRLSSGGESNDEEPPEKRRSSRVRQEPFDRVLPTKLRAVIDHWRVENPVTADNQVAADVVAEQITPSDDRNCAAVFRRQAGLPLVAMNTWNTPSVEGGGAANHAVVYANGAYERVVNNTVQMHAEMQILQYCFTSNYAGPYYYIGISKRCCLRCAQVMKIQGFSSRGCSGGLWDAGWAIPQFIRNTPAKLESFMGNDVYQWYTALLEQSKKESFLNALQTAVD